MLCPLPKKPKREPSKACRPLPPPADDLPQRFIKRDADEGSQQIDYANYSRGPGSPKDISELSAGLL